MISKIRPRSYGRYTSLSLLGSILDGFTAWSHKRGYNIGTIGRQLGDSVQIDRFLRRRGTQYLCDLNHSSFDAAWRYYHRRSSTLGGTIRQIERFLDETRGLAPLACPPITFRKLEMNRFADYLRSVRGLANGTICSYTTYLEQFLEYIGYDTNATALKKLTSKKIEDFLCTCAKRLNRYSIQNVVGYLRTFLRFQYDKGVLEKPFYTEIDTPRIYRLERLPRSLPRIMVEAFLSSIDRTSQRGIRDYTMFFLIATYGLRRCEIASLTLDDIDWRTGILRIAQRKTGNQLLLPLTDAAGDVLIEYLRKARLNVSFRELFFRAHAPNVPLKPTGVTQAFAFWVRRSGLDIPYHGPHCLRHSYVQHLRREGIPVKTISDLLGHRSTESVSAYLRLAVEDLRSVALPVPQGPSVTSPLKIKYCQKARSSRKVANPFTKIRVPLKSFLAEKIWNYLQLMRSLGRGYIKEAGTLRSLDAFLVKQYPLSKDLTVEMFNEWCVTFCHVSSTVRRNRMLHVRKFCLYRCRSRPYSFVPDLLTFPAKHQPGAPYIFSESDIARLLSATQYLPSCKRSPLRPQTFHIAVLLLYTTGLRCGELLRLKLDNYNSAEKTLFIQDSKFHKSRLIPLSPSVTKELEAFLKLRLKKHLPMDAKSPLLWHGCIGSKGKGYTETGLAYSWRALCTTLGIFTKMGKPPRRHDLRHSFAVNVLRRWYQAGEDVQVKLPLLSAFMGHISIQSTCYYITFVEGIRSEASARFQQCFGSAITTANPNS